MSGRGRRLIAAGASLLLGSVAQAQLPLPSVPLPPSATAPGAVAPTGVATTPLPISLPTSPPSSTPAVLPSVSVPALPPTVPTAPAALAAPPPVATLPAVPPAPMPVVPAVPAPPPVAAAPNRLPPLPPIDLAPTPNLTAVPLPRVPAAPPVVPKSTAAKPVAPNVPPPDPLWPSATGPVPTAGPTSVSTAAPGGFATPSSPPGSTPASESVPLKFEAKWNNGLFLQTANKEFVFHLGGTLQYDAGWFSGGTGVQTFPGGVGRFTDGVAPRRARLRAEGTIYDDFDFVMEYEFANGFYPNGLTAPVGIGDEFNAAGFTDLFVTAKHVPLLGNVRVGNQKEPFSLEAQNSHRYLEFMERSYLFDVSQTSAFNNQRSPGVSAFRTWADDRVFTAAGVFKNSSDPFGYGLADGEYAATGRIGGLPLYEPGCERYVYVGGAMSYRDPVNDQVRVRTRGSVRQAPPPFLNVLADTGTLNADSQTLYNLQSAAAFGPITLQAEYLCDILRGASTLAGVPLGTVRVQGYYAEALVFLTGEHRSWDPKLARTNRVIPNSNFGFAHDGRCGGWGAVEVGGRYTYLNLDDGAVRGGRLNDVTLGVTWYWNPNLKFQANYDYVYRDGAANPEARGSIHSLGTRLALDF